MRERENMPTISAAARRTLDNYPPAKPAQSSKLSKSQLVTRTCSCCNQNYAESAALTEKLNEKYHGICLICLKQTLKESKEAKYPYLRELRQDLNEIEITYKNLYNKWKAQAKEFQNLDYQLNMIIHHEIQIKEKKPVNNKPSKPKEQSSKQLALKALSNLSPEQQAAVLKLLQNK